MKIKHPGPSLLVVVATILFLGIAFLATISAPASLKNFDTTSYYFLHQLIYGVALGAVLGLIAFLLPIKIIRKLAPFALLICLIFLALVLLPQFGLRFWGANRWINLGGVVFQPSEFLKIFVILYLASWLKSRLTPDARGAASLKPKSRAEKTRGMLIPFMIFLTVVSIMLILQPATTTLGIIGLIMLFMYFSSGTPVWHSVVIILVAIAVLTLLVVMQPYRLSRLTTFLNPEIDPMGKGLQTKQALIAVGSGGITGRGLGASSQKFGFLPQSMTDSIFAVLAEESGLIGSIVLILLFLLFLLFGIIIARRANDKFCQLAALGIVFWIVLQGFVNISAMVGISPLGGVPLPFISYGGSHIVSELIGVGILLNIARHQKT